LIESDDDVHWKEDIRESDADMQVGSLLSKAKPTTFVLFAIGTAVASAF
jgi:hypothetical protein